MTSRSARRNRLVSSGSKDKPDAAARLATRIVSVVEALRNQPNLGRVWEQKPGSRIGNWGHSVHCFVLGREDASYYQYGLTRGAIKKKRGRER